MALSNINIDDRTYDQLLTVLRQHIPTQEWRDHNPSDPGIMLLELLAWLGEMSLYRMNRVPDGNREKFLKLIADPPQPTTSSITFTGMLAPSRPVGQPLVLPAGTRLATDFSNGRRFVFETLEEVALGLGEHVAPDDALQKIEVSVNARERVIVDSQRIGVSDGTADQIFPLKLPRDLIETPYHGFTPSLADGGKLGESSGITRILFDETDLEAAHMLSYDPATSALTLRRLGGPSLSMPVAPSAIGEKETETLSFPAPLDVEVVLDDRFDKSVAIEVTDAIVTITGGGEAPGSIDPSSVAIFTARGLPQPQGSTLLTFSRLETPATAVISTDDGLTGIVDLASTGAKTVYLDDHWGRGFQLAFSVTQRFNGAEESAEIDLEALQNLFFLGPSRQVRHSPWSEVLMDFVYRTPEFDPNPQVRVSAGITPALAGGEKLAMDSGFADVSYPVASAEQAFLFRYLPGPPPRLGLRRPGESEQTVEIESTPILPGTTETVSFRRPNLMMVLDHRFDKSTLVNIEQAEVSCTGGSGDIDPVSVRIAAIKGLLPPFASITLSFSNLCNPGAVVISAGPGLRGVVNLLTTGSKIARLTDVWERRLDVRFWVDREFDGAEVSASIELHELKNLFFLGSLWEARRSLRTGDSRVVRDTPVRHCHVDPFDSTLRFGDGAFGSIPPSGAEIVASYRVLQGPEALVRENELEYLLDPPPRLASEDESLSFANKDGEGGLRFFSPETRTAEALIDLSRTYRLVTAEDFERVLLTDFNEFDAMAQAAPNVLSPEEKRARATANPTIRRAVAMMNRDAALQERRGHVAILVLPRAGIELDDWLKDRILRFLDERRLVTTRLSLTSPRQIGVSVTTFVIVESGRSLQEMRQRLQTVLHDFFDIYTGYFDGTGWPLGRTVHRSELYQVLEGVEGVDHVESLALSPADADQNVSLTPGELPILQQLELSVDRA